MQIFDRTETILFIKNFSRGCTEFPEFSMLVEMPWVPWVFEVCGHPVKRMESYQ